MKIWIKILIPIFSIGALAGLGYAGYYYYQNKLNDTNDKENNIDFYTNNNFKAKDIFPNLYAGDFYQTIKISDGKVLIDEDLVSQFIKNLVSKILVNYGTISFRHKVNKSKNEIFIEIFWQYKNNKLNRNYHFILSKDIVK
ncbi:Uncharacterised protein [Mesomycoplasma conjunctivae]|uniref:MHO_1590 family protein n=1 Tax=Mesomycoplasma conjunctivae TaxID=45361 RepID=UPI0005A05383|nr:hypothetical protein [Mesomycoplasma conjunctivae]VEU66576.1 Uncharacterised protein [Mesomycoplasma conjunctivae]